MILWAARMGWRVRSCSSDAFTGWADQQQEHRQECQTNFAFAVHVMPSTRFIATDRPVRLTRKSLAAEAQSSTPIQGWVKSRRTGCSYAENRRRAARQADVDNGSEAH